MYKYYIISVIIRSRITGFENELEQRKVQEVFVIDMVKKWFQIVK